MFLKPAKLGEKEIPEKILSEDRKHCKKIGPCGIGKEAIYLNSFYLERRYYVPVSSVSRVFKRVAMSKGGFTGKGLFATMPYLVVVLDDGSEKQCNFKYEDQVDAFVSAVKEKFPQVKTVSEAAEKRLAEAEKKEAQKRLIPLSEQAKESVGILEQAKEKLSKRMSLFTELTNAAKKKRTYEKTKPFYKWLALFMVIMGAAALGYGVYSFMNHDTFAVYFVLFGMAAIFLFSGANVMPTSTNNRKAIEKRLASAETAVESYVDSLHLGLPVPSCYLHPVTVERMERVIREGRAESVEDAFAAVKDDLRKTNADVSVTQEEFDEIMAIKPVFLVRDYA